MPTPTLDDIAHTWGEDLRLSPSGDLARSNGVDRTRERVLRRLLTNPQEYLWQPEYGAGLPQEIGRLLDAPKLEAIVRGQMLIEPSVSAVLEVDLAAQDGAVRVSVRYVSLPDKQPVVLSFDLSV